MREITSLSLLSFDDPELIVIETSWELKVRKASVDISLRRN